MRGLLRIATLSMLALTMPAVAAPEPHQPLQDTLDQAESYSKGNINTPQARRAIESYGICTAKREPAEAARLLTMDFRTARYRTGLRILANEAERKCAYDTFGRGVLRSGGLLFSGALAEALLEADSTPLNARLVSKAGVKTKPFSATDAVALCVARSVPDQVTTLFATAPGSDAEVAAAAPLAQAVPACAQATGVRAKLELSVPALRAMVATAAYRLLAEQGDKNA